MPAIAPLTHDNLTGVWPALLLPWTDDDRLDEPRFREEIRGYRNTGVSGIYTAGTTGEFYALDDDTFQQVTRIACAERHALGLPVQIGCTALSTRTVCQRIEVARDAGADGVQVALPFWLTLKDDEVLTFFEAISRAARETPIILYQTMRAKRRIDPPLLAELADRVPSLIGMKDTGCSIEQLKAMTEAVPDLAIFGSEHDLLPKMQAGGRGTYSSVALLNPAFVVNLYEHCAAGRFDEAAPLQQTLLHYMTELLYPLVHDEGLMDSAVDRLQRIAGGIDVGLRCQPPYRSATPQHLEQLQNWCRQNTPELLPPDRDPEK